MLDLEAKYRDEEGDFFFTGIQALVRVPLDQMRVDRRNGLRTASFISGYQGSPLGGFDRELIDRKALLEQLDIVHQPGLNEELGATAVMGSQLSTMFPKQKLRRRRRHLVRQGARPRPGRRRHPPRQLRRHPGPAACWRWPATTRPASPPRCRRSSEYTLADLHVPVLHPGNVQEILDLGLHGIALSRASGLWTGIKIVTAVADGAGHRRGRSRAHPPVIPDGRVPGPALPAAGHRQPRRRPGQRGRGGDLRGPHRPRPQYAVLNPLNPITVDPDDAWLGIVASGHSYHEIVEALHKLGLDEADLRRQRASGCCGWSCCTRSRPGSSGASPAASRRSSSSRRSGRFVEIALKDALYGRTDAPRVIGKKDGDGQRLIAGHGAARRRRPRRAASGPARHEASTPPG